MRAFATKQPNQQDATHQKPVRANPAPVVRSHNISPLSTGIPLLQRQCACGGGCPRCQEADLLQTKLKIGEPGDQYEQEADRLADEVMRMPEPSIQRQIETQEEETNNNAEIPTEAKIEEELEEEEIIQTKPTANHNPNQPAKVPSIVQDVFSSPGQPLDAATRAFMEPRFGQNFSGVRIHTSDSAETAAQSLSAHAFTVGHHIGFAPGHYAPESLTGKHLLAHELTHVVQQGALPTTQIPEVVQAYRPKGSTNFGICNPNKVEKPFPKKPADINKAPWIENITVNFTGTKIDSNQDTVPIGKLNATYNANAGKLPDVNLGVIGGMASEGLSDKVTDEPVKRIEGCGYHHALVPKAERVPGHPKYYKPDLAQANATMNFAIFYIETQKSGNQAIHFGPLDSGSLGCVHVGDWAKMQQLNYHSIKNKTKVTISYNASAQQAACCARYKVKGYMVSNPCGSEDPKKC